jgi:hypothetical protein
MGLIQDYANNTVETMSRKGMFAALLFITFLNLKRIFNPTTTQFEAMANYSFAPRALRSSTIMMLPFSRAIFRAVEPFAVFAWTLPAQRGGLIVRLLVQPGWQNYPNFRKARSGAFEKGLSLKSWMENIGAS